MKKLMLVLILGVIMSVVPMFVYAGEDDQGQDDDSQGGTIILCPPTGCIQ